MGPEGGPKLTRSNARLLQATEGPGLWIKQILLVADFVLFYFWFNIILAPKDNSHALFQ